MMHCFKPPAKQASTVSRLAAPRMTEPYSLVSDVVYSSPKVVGSLASPRLLQRGRTRCWGYAGGRADPGASDLNSHPAGNLGIPGQGSPRGGQQDTLGGGLGGQPQQLGGMDRQLISFPGSDLLPSMHCTTKTARVLPEEFKGTILSTQLNDRMSGTLVVAGQPRGRYLPSCLLHRCKGKSLISAVQLCVAVTKLRRSARPGGPADLSETGMFDLVEVPFFAVSQNCAGTAWGTSLD